MDHRAKSKEIIYECKLSLITALVAMTGQGFNSVIVIHGFSDISSAKVSKALAMLGIS